MEYVVGENYWDTEVKGLHLRIFETKKCYYLFYRTKQGAQRRPKLGDASIITLAQARKLGREMLARVTLGEDPSHTARLERLGDNMQSVFEACYKEHWSKERFKVSKWGKEAARLWEKQVRPTFGNRAISRITPDDIEAWHQKYVDHPVVGNRSLSVLSKLFIFAQKKRLIPQGINPCSLVSKHQEKSRDRFASPQEIEKIGSILIKYADVYPEKIAFLYLLIFTGSRPSAIERARWEDLEIRTVGSETIGILKFQGKTGSEKVVIPDKGMQIIGRISKRENNPLIFNVKMSKMHELWEKIRTEAGCPDLWMRDWRRTFSTVGLSTGHSVDLIAKSLNHSPETAKQIYAKVMEDAQIKTVSDIAGKMAGLLTSSQLSHTEASVPQPNQDDS